MKPFASLSLDLDNQWSYMKIHGDSGWTSLPSYLDRLVPRVLAFLAARNLKITFFIVGQDAAITANHEALGAISAAGHEIGNHSFHHEPWIAQAHAHEVSEELTRAHDAIERATNSPPIGFRGPGFASSPTLRAALARRGYRYDASRLATWIGPLARAYYFRSAHLSAQEMEQRKHLYGKWTDGLLANRARDIDTPDGPIVDIPVTTMPIFRLPIHCSYLLFINDISPSLADAYFAFALALARVSKTTPSLLLHPLDFLGKGDSPELAFFPGMQTPAARKLAAMDRFLAQYTQAFQVGTMSEHSSLVRAYE